MPGARILCVDHTNDGRGPFAQAYLELLRIWLANTSESRKWMFKDVSSAGLLIASEFSRNHFKLFPNNGNSQFYSKQDRNNLALSAFNRHGTFDGPEKRAVMARVGNRKIRGISAGDFLKTFILCFDKPTYETMRLLRQAASNDAKGMTMPAEIHLLEIASDLHKYDKNLQAGKEMLRKWAMKNLGWKEPVAGLHSGFWGTKQVMIPEAGFVALLRDKERRLAKIKNDTICDFHFSSEREDKMRIVSIVGRKDHLEIAATKVLYTW
jgi:hypothetical protein